MDQMAENTPEVEIETDASEQIPDDVELAEEVETEDGSESSGNDAEEATETDDDESEQEFYFGDEKLDSPTSEDGAEHGLVKHLRKTIKEKDRELKELMRQSQKPVEQQPVITQPPRMPKLDDEDIGFDEEIYQQRMAKWAEDTAADSAYQTICIALTKIPPLERRNDMPRGAGLKSAFTWNRFYIEKDEPST
ncbi:phage scaffold protein [Escherichia coli]|uniref:hypothetical protein n=1 Tax=Escherichia coli TaxID=562 RepID=UPI000DA5C7A4|nr:hypothetical protein [Escherichia coli]SQJ71959.1 phage scaffold protein [Escherichia coli]